MSAGCFSERGKPRQRRLAHSWLCCTVYQYTLELIQWAGTWHMAHAWATGQPHTGSSFRWTSPAPGKAYLGVFCSVLLVRYVPMGMARGWQLG